MEDFSREKLKVQHSQPMTEGKEALQRVDKRWIISLDPICQKFSGLSVTDTSTITGLIFLLTLTVVGRTLLD